MNKLTKGLIESLNSRSKEELKEIWESGDYLDEVGIKVIDLLENRMKDFFSKVKPEELVKEFEDMGYEFEEKKTKQ